MVQAEKNEALTGFGAYKNWGPLKIEGHGLQPS